MIFCATPSSLEGYRGSKLADAMAWDMEEIYGSHGFCY